MPEKKIWPQHLFQGNATSFIKVTALKYCKGDGIDFGAGKWCLPGAIPVDHATYFGLEDFTDNSLDFVFSSHCLEHIADWKNTLSDLLAKIKPTGIIFLYLPHKDSPWTGWRKHKWVPTTEIILSAFEGLHIEPLNYNTVPDEYQSFYVIGRKQIPGG